MTLAPNTTHGRASDPYKRIRRRGRGLPIPSINLSHGSADPFGLAQLLKETGVVPCFLQNRGLAER